MSSRELDAAGIRDPHLRESYELCRRLNAQHAGQTLRAATTVPHLRAIRGAMNPAPKTTKTVEAKKSASSKEEKPKPSIRIAGAIAKNMYSEPMTRLTGNAGAMNLRSMSNCQ